jgi:hypothetical protein
MTPIDQLNDARMRHLAKLRAQVRLEDGRTAILHWWKLPRRGNYARVEFRPNVYATLRATAICAVREPDANTEEKKGNSHEG